jgi:hypothetical protein
MARRRERPRGYIMWLAVVILWWSSTGVALTQNATPEPVRCAAGPASPVVEHDSAEAPSPRVSTTNGEGCLLVTLEIDSRSAGPRSLEVTISSSVGEPLHIVSVSIQVRHLTMDHGASTYEAVQIAPDHFQAEQASMGMEGPWQVHVSIQLPHAGPVFTEFEIVLVGPG